MIKKFRFIFVLLFLLLLISCEVDQIADPFLNHQDVKYAFFVAGHTYGNPVNYQYGLHPPFVHTLDQLNSIPNLDLGILTGDVVPIPSMDYWNAAIEDIEKIDVPVHIAAGNHDRGIAFEELFGAYYFSFIHKDDLFIVLNPTDWNIEGAQKEFLVNTLEDNHQEVHNIFIFSHELIWWSPINQFGNIEINFKPHFPGTTNFWTEISPILNAYPNPITVFAGDVGATAEVSPYMYYQYDNVTLIASGMGSNEHDNLVVVEVLEDHSLRYRLIGLNYSSLYEIDNLIDFQLP